MRAYEVGPSGRLSPLVLLDYLQEAAGVHARALGVEFPALPTGPGTWVLARLRVEIACLPEHGDEAVVETWPSDEDGLRAYRDSIVRDGAGAELARATTEWLVIDPARRRPARLPPDVLSISRPDRARALAPAVELEPTAPAAVEAEDHFRVRRADLDRVGHANNVRFAEWALEGVPDAWADGHTLTAIDIRYRAEAVHGETVRVEVGPGEKPGAFLHRLTRAADGFLLALARTSWTEP
ncbi:MAG TPA: acyl-ACP thioesterase domain-containing protein [Rhodothermales bacterium]|nr:acyl-ACP thioesterase domain-containing protein [Rhodothermales bacterium]